eukprot:6800571-Alexandrium_andersonii.AAC.1
MGRIVGGSARSTPPAPHSSCRRGWTGPHITCFTWARAACYQGLALCCVCLFYVLLSDSVSRQLSSTLWSATRPQLCHQSHVAARAWAHSQYL